MSESPSTVSGEQAADQLLEKLAFAETPATSAFTEHREYIRAQDEQRREAQLLQDVITLCQEKAAGILDGLARKAWQHPEAVAEAELDLASSVGAEEAKAWFDKVAAVAKQAHRVSWERPLAFPMVKLARDRHAVVAEYAAYNEAMGDIAAAREMLKEATTTAKRPPRSAADTDTSPSGGSSGAAGGPWFPELPYEGESPAELASTDLYNSTASMTEGTVRHAAPWAARTARDTLGGVATAGEGAGEALVSAAATAESRAQALGRLLAGPGAKNTAQQKVDKQVQLAKAQVNLQRLMVSDPVISEADPQQVADMFATLYNANPQMTQDPVMLRVTLREGLALDAMPVQTYQDLTKTRGLAQQNEERARDENRDKYKVRDGGTDKAPARKPNTKDVA